VDYPPINERIQAGFLNWTQGATGILYYRADGWTAGNAIASWNNVDTTACAAGSEDRATVSSFIRLAPSVPLSLPLGYV